MDPELDSSIVLTADRSEFSGPLVGNLDGTYSRSIRFAAGSEPAIGLQVSGEEIIRPTLLVQTGQPHYVDRVVEFHQGGEAEEGANRHDDPQAVLGDILAKDEERFLSLGAFGSVTLAIESREILDDDGSEDDLTIFLHRDEGLRPYRVETLRAVGSTDWVEVGTSSGITQSFSLGKAGIARAKAIRVSDLSGHVVDRDFRPISSPGVSLRGVGVKRVSEPKGCFWLALKFLTLGRWGGSSPR